MRNIGNSLSHVGELSVLPFFSTSLIEKELPDYLSMAEDVDSAMDPIARWKDHEYRLPKWKLANVYTQLLLREFFHY